MAHTSPCSERQKTDLAWLAPPHPNCTVRAAVCFRTLSQRLQSACTGLRASRILPWSVSLSSQSDFRRLEANACLNSCQDACVSKNKKLALLLKASQIIPFPYWRSLCPR